MNSASYRNACANEVFSRLVTAFNSGDGVALATIFNNETAEHPFEWVSDGSGLTFWVERSPMGAIDRLLARHAVGERWTSVVLSAGPGPSWHGGVDFSLKMERVRPDPPNPTADGVGKGALSCKSGRVYVLSM